MKRNKNLLKNKAEQEKDKLYNNAFVRLSAAERKKFEEEIGNNSCGVIDILKINVKYLRKIYNGVAIRLHDKTRNKYIALISYHNSIISNDSRVQDELDNILQYEQKVLALSEYQSSIDLKIVKSSNETTEENRNKKKEIEEGLRAVYVLDRGLQVSIETECRKNEDCKDEKENTAPQHQKIIRDELEKRENSLLKENKRYTDDLQRINPTYTKVMEELNQIKADQKQMNKLFDGSLEALDTWGETHSNLRDSLTTKKPLTVSRLVSSVRYLWEILKPSETNNN